MNGLIWNVRGLAASGPRLSHLINKWRIHFFVAIEPLVDIDKADHYKMEFGFSNVVANNRTKVWIFWDSSSITISDVNWNSQFVHFKYSWCSSNGWITAIYAKHTHAERRELWAHLTQFASTIQTPWLVGGDFNTIMYNAEHKGDSIPNLTSMLEFKECVSQCNLIDIPYSGCQYTWTGVRSRGRLWRRLDRCLFNESFLDSFDQISVTNLNQAPSDHSPMLIQCLNNYHSGPKPFRFLNMWLTHNTFLNTVSQSWNDGFTGGGMQGLVIKLQKLKKDLKRWNKETFGNIFDDIKFSEQEVEKAEMDYLNSPSEENREVWQLKKALLLRKYKIERKYWKQKANVRWLKEGDSNTHYFHSYVKVRRRKQMISIIKDSEGRELSTLPDIGVAAVDFYSNLYAVDPLNTNNEILGNIPGILDQEDNNYLTGMPTEEEVKGAIWDLNQNGAPGPDGFNGKFFKKCWHIVGPDVVKAVQEFFIGIPPPRGFSSSLIVLIPKTEVPSTFSEFRPICLSNFNNKICTKVLASRLVKVLPKLISEEQAGFVKGRDISDQILIAQEMVHAIDKKVRGSNVIIKLDMAKAFDQLSWSYLFEVLDRFGFSDKFISLIRNNLQSTYLSIMINGSPQGFFQPKRGVKQGDPISPFLFILASEGFSRGIKARMEKGLIKPFWMGNKGYPISHLGFADDLLIFINGDARSLVNFKKFLEDYQSASGQTVNLEKSNFITGKQATYRSSTIHRIMGMRVSSLPMKYLGANLHKGMNKFQYCSNIINHFDSKLSPWQQKNLSQGGRLVLIKYVLNTIPNYVLATDKLPKRVISALEKKMASFLWGSTEGRRKFHWANWIKICFPTEEGGLGVRALSDVEKAFSLKLWWKWRTQDSPWCKFIKAKYSRGVDMQPRVTDSSVWRRLCGIHDIATNMCSVNDTGAIQWDPGINGCFSLSSAYHEIREQRSITFTDKHIWNTHQQMQIKVFLWKLLNSYLPTPDNLQRFHLNLQPSMCPFCRRSCVTTNHLFFDCSYTKRIWQHFMDIFGINMPSRSSVRQVLVLWWLEAGSKTMADIFKHNLPGIVCWHIWKAYTAYTWGDRAIPDSGMTTGGAILRNRTGELVWAVCFRIQALSSEEAELKALMTATELAIEEGFVGVQVETDATRSLDFISGGESGNLAGFRNLIRKAREKDCSFDHVFRQGNGPAHYLACQNYPAAQVVRFDRVSHLPAEVKNSYYADLFGFPSLRL
ncbi:unnamed protein product [Cuscuta epithymum]|uniref:Reverse transcriptase domain-containing protein n=1 Tax=Cuscuta epithymum TaxID=186058 RepID=A0AAV0C5Z1_9ASTE|nr:unnamed protein product [Cuscuta epithymum]